MYDMINRKFPIIAVSILILFYVTQISGQAVDAEGDVRIIGDIDIRNDEDSTSLYIGHKVGVNNIGSMNTMVGFQAGLLNQEGSNTFFGAKTGENNSEGRLNAFFGVLAGNSNTTGFANSFYGNQAGANNSTGSLNSFFGNNTGFNTQSGINNSFFGSGSGNFNTTGNSNTALGAGAAVNIGKTNEGVFIGMNSGLTQRDTSFNEAIAIGFNARVGCENCAVLGGVDTNAVHVGIGLTTPDADLHIQGPDNTEAIKWDNGQATLRHSFDALIWQRDFFHLFIDSNNDQNNAKFSIYKDTFQSQGNSPIVNFNLDGFDSWINTGGDLGIGTTAPTERLEVKDGNIRITNGEYIDDGTTLDVPDYVFGPQYQLRTIQEIDHYIQRHKHLPGVPSMDDIAGWSELSLQDRDMLLLEKVEELFLHTIDQENKIKWQEEEISELKSLVRQMIDLNKE